MVFQNEGNSTTSSESADDSVSVHLCIVGLGNPASSRTRPHGAIHLGAQIEILPETDLIGKLDRISSNGRTPKSWPQFCIGHRIARQAYYFPHFTNSSELSHLQAFTIVNHLEMRHYAPREQAAFDRYSAWQTKGFCRKTIVASMLSLRGKEKQNETANQNQGRTAKAVNPAPSSLILLGGMWHRFSWTKMRLGLTHQLVEKMSAHRTRLAQQSPGEWHYDEDRENAQYAEMSETLDRSSAWIEAALPRCYVIAAFAVLAPSFLSGKATLTQLAISFGAILFTSSAIERLTTWISPGSAAWIAWQNVKPMFDAAVAPDDGKMLVEFSSSSDTVLQAHNVVFTHQGRHEPILKRCSLAIERGDFVLLEGDSGSGKSTLVSLLSGLRSPSGGLLLAGGLDRHTLGEATWHHRIAVAPQYHENHIFTAPLSFNLLLGRPYPHTAQDIDDAKELCDELGLGTLLDRMPAGLDQIVGETGWQLSQGERGRVFLARALLQNAEVVMLDESLGALDPQNLRQCLDCVTRRAKTLLLVAHP